MTRNDVINEYFDWLCSFIISDGPPFVKIKNYRKLLTKLHDIEFRYIIPLDGNRAEDGVDLRYRFADDNEYSPAIIVGYLDDKPCSVLEMLVALSIRCEEHIMDDPDIGNRTAYWFWGMIDNLKLGAMTNAKYNEKTVDKAVSIFLDRRYQRNGVGGLFTINNCEHDLRTVEIWYQMHWYLDSIL